MAAATAFALFVIAFVWLLLPASAPGPDFGKYNGWARAFLSGNVFSSSVFSGGRFQSFAWSEPEILAVLAHPWHGLLTYHPLYGLGFVALCLTLARSRAWRERSMCLAAIGIVL